MVEQAGRLTLTSRAFHNDQLALFYEEIAALTGSHKVLPMNSGAEAVESAIKSVRKWGYEVKGVPDGQAEIIVCADNFHGRTLGIIGFSTDPAARDHFGPFAAGFKIIAFGDAAALKEAITPNTVAFLVEPIQGEAGVVIPPSGYFTEVRELCAAHDVMLILDEIQTGLGRTGRFLACEHDGALPDMVLLAKALSGGHVPVGAVLMRKAIFDKVFNRMDRAVVHGSTFAKNDLAMAAGMATLEVMQVERVIENAARMGERLLRDLSALCGNYELLKEVRGKGLMIGVEFGSPSSLKLKASWNVLETASKGLFCQLITIPLFKDHKILTQVAGHASHTVKLIPPLILNDADCGWIVRAFDAVIADSHRASAVWSLGKTLVEHAMRANP
jgi:ornithine--oxo-acid transaminase